MKKMRILCLILFVFIVNGSYAQYMLNMDGGMVYLNPSPDHIGDKFKRGSYTSEHVLGEEVTDLLNKFESKYIYYRPGHGAYAVEEKVVLKPVLYKKIKQVEKFIVKEYQKKRLPEAEAEQRVLSILEMGNELAKYDTQTIEQKLVSIKTPQEIEAFFLKVQFK